MKEDNLKYLYNIYCIYSPSLYPTDEKKTKFKGLKTSTVLQTNIKKIKIKKKHIQIQWVSYPPSMIKDRKKYDVETFREIFGITRVKNR
jgi:hypothetical protein